jgi:DNA-binding transcriptional ArsR family regulator
LPSPAPEPRRRSARPAGLDSAFAALADPTRRKVISALMKEPLRAGELAARVSMSAPALSRHLRTLRRAGLIVESGVEHDARVRLYRLNAPAFASARTWLEQVEELWTDQLQAFKLHAERSEAGSKRKP